MSGKANKISEIDALQNINSEITKEELDKIIRATHTKEFPVKIKIHGFNFILDKDWLFIFSLSLLKKETRTSKKYINDIKNKNKLKFKKL